MKVYYYRKDKNVGDILIVPILQYFLKCGAQWVPETTSGKLVGIGSIMGIIKPGDIVWGAGCMWPRFHDGRGVRFLAVRGKLTRDCIRHAKVPEIYGDPALLLPLMYHPEIEKRHKIGLIPHYVDREMITAREQGKKIIDVGWPWRKFVDEVLSCEEVISSSLHGIIIAEAYGIPAIWAVWSDKVLGKGFKFRDYLTGTGRKIQEPFTQFPPIENLADIQNKLIKALKRYYANFRAHH